MTKILYSKPLLQELESNLRNVFLNKYWKNKYITIFLLQEHKPSQVYVKKKKEFGEKIGLKVNIVDWKTINNLKTLLEQINDFNNDENCKGIVIQLPLPDKFKPFEAQILASINPIKDIDGLGGILTGLSSINLIDFIPATPKAVIKLLEYYNLANFQGKKIAILGQSNLVGKPLALELIKRGGEIFSFNHFCSDEKKIPIIKQVDYIFSATGKIHLIDEKWINPGQIIVDIGWGYKNGKPAGDVNFEKVKNIVTAISPVPGGVGPITVASLFENVLVLDKLQNKIKQLPYMKI